jgi:serine/threonine-protein kinase
VTPDLERLVLKCLAKSPDQRPQSAAKLREALEWISTDGWGEEQATKWWSSNSRAIEAASAI